MTLAEVEAFEIMVRLARLSVHARRDPDLVRWFYESASPEQVETYRRLYATNPEVRRAVDLAYADELRNVSGDPDGSATQDRAEPRGASTGGERKLQDE